MSNEINKDILLKLNDDDTIENNVKKFIMDALKLEYKSSIDNNKNGTFKRNYLKLIDKYIEE